MASKITHPRTPCPPRAVSALFALALLGLTLLGGCAMLPPASDVLRPPSSAILATPATALGQVAANSLPAPGLTGFRLLPVGSYALNTRLALARRAEVSLDVQYYVVHDDDTGRYLLRALRDAAQRGVRVRLLMDDLYTEGEDPLLLGLAAYPNVEIRLFNPFPGGRSGGVVSRFAASLLDFGRVNHRMHNKLFIADGAFAVAGGRNIGNEYFMRSGVTNFVDLDTFVTGALVPQLQFFFDHYWNSPFVFPLHAIVPPTADAQALREQFEAATNESTTPPPSAPPPNDVLGYGPLSEEFDDGRIGLVWAQADADADPPEKIIDHMPGVKRLPYLDEESVRQNVLERLRSAQSEVVLTSPYLIPGEKGFELFRQLRARGVKVKLLTNSLAATDEPLVHIGYKRYRQRMLKLGVELYELSPARVKRSRRLGMFAGTLARLHAKTAVIDRRLVFIGSMNFDPRSEKHNTEMGIFIDSPQLAREMLRLMDLDKLQASYRLRLAPGTDAVQWLAMNDDGEVAVLDEEPDVDLWTLFWLTLLSPLAPEELL
jgi:putative cardiolipin synthase